MSERRRARRSTRFPRPAHAPSHSVDISPHKSDQSDDVDEPFVSFAVQGDGPARLSIADALKVHRQLESALRKLGTDPHDRPVNKLAITALALGIAGLVTLGLTGIVGTPVGHAALRRSRTMAGSGRSMAITALICSYVCICMWASVWIAALILAQVTDTPLF